MWLCDYVSFREGKVASELGVYDWKLEYFGVNLKLAMMACDGQHVWQKFSITDILIAIETQILSSFPLES